MRPRAAAPARRPQTPPRTPARRVPTKPPRPERRANAMLMPKRMQQRKGHRGTTGPGKAQRGNTVAFGEYGLQALEAAWIDSRQIESGPRAITHYVKRGGKVWIRIFPDKSMTQRPAETRMGSGKGAPDHWGAVVRPARLLVQLGGVEGEAG